MEINAKKKRAAKAVNTEVDHVSNHSGTLTWKQTDNALPMPINLNNPTTALVMRSSDFMQALDQEPLRVTHLKAERYTLKIDDEEVGSFTADQLKQGINLAELSTPMIKQAMSVATLTVKHTDVHNTRWRMIQVPLTGFSAPHLQPVLDDLNALDGELIEEQRAAALPKTRTYELIPQ